MRLAHLRPKKKPVSWKVRIFRSLGMAVGIVFLVYLWNPQKVELFPKTPPKTPQITPEQIGLFSPGKRVSVVVGHPDDPEFYISGTLLKLKAAGAKLQLIVTTDGSKEYYPPFTTNVEENKRVRREEQIESARVYGADVVFLAEPDGRMVPDERVQGEVLAALQKFDPEVIITFDGDYPPRIQHRDHRNSGIATEAVARQTSAKWLLRFGTRGPNLFVDTSGLWDERSRLLAIHKSQFYGEKLERIRGMVMQTAFDNGTRAGFEMAEAFRATSLK